MWAYEYEAGKFIAGEILGDTLYMYAPTGRGEKWIMNSEGIVLEYSSEPFQKSDEIIAGINAHYGTSFYQEDDIDKDFTIGETMPDWDAYEKIEMPQSYIMLSGEFSNGNPFGIIENDIFKISSKTQTNCWLCSNNGDIVADINLSQVSKEEMLFHIQHYFPNVEEIEMFIEDFSIGDKITVTDYPWPE